MAVAQSSILQFLPKKRRQEEEDDDHSINSNDNEPDTDEAYEADLESESHRDGLREDEVQEREENEHIIEADIGASRY